ncbi:MAG TPA: 3-hydroxyacyl-CoA dehydrogenase family protein [Thermodesulfobacteriota bacterium]|nr:3-hydroxyacyl-CoA dehydrogenase family protein [Thermodesulfobacteriota bacterium]
MKVENVKRISVLGAGIMGHGIAQSFLMGGYPVHLYDVQDSILQTAVAHIRSNLELFVQVGLLRAGEIEASMKRLTTTTELEEAVKESDFIIEAAPEKVELKQTLLEQVESYCPKESILASNTSSLTLKQMGMKVKNKGRLVITHWFNPPHIVPAVEVVRGEETNDETFDTAFELLRKIKKLPVKIHRELPGFIVNRLQVALAREVFDLYQKGVASAADIDTAVRGSIGFRLASIGPLLTADLGGLDLWLQVAKNLLPLIQSSTEAPKALQDLVSGGNKGIKSGKGFYDYAHDFSEGQLDEVVKKRDREFLERLKNLYWKE